VTRAEWEALKPGDVIEATLSGRRYTVTRIARVLMRRIAELEAEVERLREMLASIGEGS
jgi:hypothetical protein